MLFFFHLNPWTIVWKWPLITTQKLPTSFDLIFSHRARIAVPVIYYLLDDWVYIDEVQLSWKTHAILYNLRLMIFNIREEATCYERMLQHSPISARLYFNHPWSEEFHDFWHIPDQERSRIAEQYTKTDVEVQGPNLLIAYRHVFKDHITPHGSDIISNQITPV